MKGTILASIFSAAGASLCCVGPAVVLLFGSTSLGAFSFVEPIRPYTSVLAIGLLGFAHFRLHGRKPKEACCDIDEEKAMKKQRLQERALWGLTPVILALVLFPYAGSFLYAGGEKPEGRQDHVQAEWTVEGMTCQWCAKGLEGGMSNVKGVSKCTVDYESKSMVCTFDKNLVSADAIPGLVEKMGFKATPKEKEDESKEENS